MIISDLNYLTDVSTCNLTGGFGGRGLTAQINYALVLQNAKSSSKAFSYHGDATAVSISTNDAVILQSAISIG